MQHSDEDPERASQWMNLWNDIFPVNSDAAENAESAFCPPEPAPDEQPGTEDPAFLANCRADVEAMSKGPVVWGDELLTRNPRWGLVWRADFWDPKNKDQLYPSRVACWKDDSGALGMTISGGQHGKLALKR